MKIWYQSFANFQHLPRYGIAIQKYLQTLCGDAMEFEVHGLDSGGLGDEFRIFEYFDTANVLRNVLKAGRLGFDAVAIGNILDPGLWEARQVSTIPVLGLCESSLVTASLMGRKFCLVTINEHFNPRIEENVRRYGFADRLAGIKTIGIQVSMLDSAYEDEKVRNEIVDQFLKAADPLVREGSEIVIPAGGVMMLLLALAGVHKVRDVPIVNGIVALANVAQMMVRFRNTTGVFVSRRMTFAPPDEKRWAEAQEIYRLT